MAPMLVAAALTASYYGILSTGVLAGTTLEHYSMGHWIEGVTITLFFWGMCDLAFKGLRLPKQRRAFREEWLKPVSSPQPASLAAQDYQNLVGSEGDQFSNTYLVRRLRHALDYVSKKNSADSLEDHLQYLAELESSQSHAGMALVRIIAWMIPILGFLGTVMGITLSIANLTPDQLESSLPEVTSGLAVAFDTTALSLSLSMILMFYMFLIERGEQKILHEVETKTGNLLAHRYQVGNAEMQPVAAAMQYVGEHILHGVEKICQAMIQRSEQLVERQTEIWSDALMQVQQHAEMVQVAHEQRLSEIFDQVRSERTEQTKLAVANTDRVAALQADLQSLVARLEGFTQADAQLAQAEDRLAENLRLMREGHNFEQMIHSLTAAIHLLTSRPQTQIGEKRVA